MKLSDEQFMKVQNWMYRNARPLELARWQYNMDSGKKESVLDLLEAFQNSDGGFGYGLEPDFWNPNSTPMASWSAAQILKEIQVSAEDPTVGKLMHYLIKTVDQKSGMWPSSMVSNNDYPHAPWWHWREGIQENWMFNPGVELSAYLIFWSKEGQEGEKIGWNSLKNAVNRLIESSEMDRHELNNYKNMLGILENKADYFIEKTGHSYESVEIQVWKLIEGCMDKSHKNWGKDYLPLPLDFIDHPKTLKKVSLQEIEDLVNRNLDFFIGETNSEGVWDITWEWGQYPEAFAVAKRNWQGILAVNRCKILKNFGRL